MTARPRVQSVDVVRGAIMILMALDHTRDFFGVAANPTDMATTTPALFLTRWVTHFCAPGFFFLMGTGAFLAGQRRTRGELAGFLLTRGAWLIFLELVIVRCFAYQFNLDYRVTMLLVLWALGWALIALAGVVWLPAAAIAALGILIIAGHNLLDGIRSANPLWQILHGPGMVLNTPRYVVFAAYPLVPWIGVTMVGYALGTVFGWPVERRRRLLARVGVGVVVAFAIVRGVNAYGDPAPWRHLASPFLTVLSFLNTTKYPPSLDFLLMTLGPLLLVLGWTERSAKAWHAPLRVFGRVPLFYFVVHFFVLHALAVVVCLARYGSAHWMFQSPDLAHYPFSPPPDWGFTLPVVYAVWISVVIALYPLCRWFADLKTRRSERWLSYL